MDELTNTPLSSGIGLIRNVPGEPAGLAERLAENAGERRDHVERATAGCHSHAHAHAHQSAGCQGHPHARRMPYLAMPLLFLLLGLLATCFL